MENSNRDVLNTANAGTFNVNKAISIAVQEALNIVELNDFDYENINVEVTSISSIRVIFDCLAYSFKAADARVFCTNQESRLGNVSIDINGVDKGIIKIDVNPIMHKYNGGTPFIRALAQLLAFISKSRKLMSCGSSART